MWVCLVSKGELAVYMGTICHGYTCNTHICIISSNLTYLTLFKKKKTY